jgi:histidyl-tRNA synthetase
VVLVIHDLMLALGLERFHIRVNNRLLLNGLLDQIGLTGKARDVLVALDKLAKDGREKVCQEMAAKGIDAAQSERILTLAETRGTNAQILDRLRHEFGGNLKAAEGMHRLQELLDVTRQAGIPEERLGLDVSIARGLDYYTGTIYETFLTDLPGIGSVCSGGRYDNLAGLFTKMPLPGVGASLGLDRLLAGLEELGRLDKVATPAPVLMVQFMAERLGDYQKMARSLRAAGIGVEVYPEAKKVGQQLQYAEKRGFKLALIAGPDEFAAGTWKVKDLEKRLETTVPAGEVIEEVKKKLQIADCRLQV